MGQVNPNGTYKGSVYDAGASNDATLTITSSDPQTGNIIEASMQYYGLTHKVDGSFTYDDLSTHESAVSFNLRAVAGPPEHNVHTISLRSLDRNYSKLDGTIFVQRGGPNVGKTYNITLAKS